MSRHNSSTFNNKRRLESDVSQASGVSVFSSGTQSTELSTDSDDRKSVSSLGNQNTGLRNDLPNNQSDKLQRTRQVSWCLCDDGDEHVLENIPQSAISRPPIAPYDNNINGTNNSQQRTRRATVSCLETQGLSVFDPQSHICSTNDWQCMHPLRNNTTSELHRHEHERQRALTHMIQEFDNAQNSRRVNQRRSHSAVCLQDHTLYTSASPVCNQHQYDSIQQQPMPPTPTNPVETIVTIANSDPNYLHPITQVKRTHATNTGTTDHQIVNEFPEVSVAPGYVTCNESNDHSECLKNCNNSFYRKGFFVLLVLNVIFVLLNVVGLPFLYFAIQSPGVEGTPPKVGAQRSNICVKCEGLDAMVGMKLSEYGVYKSDDGECCVSSVDKLLPAIMEVTDVLAWRIVQDDKNDAKNAAVQLNASPDNTHTTNDKIIWDKRPVIHNFAVQIIDGYMLEIPTTGYYYVFSRVHYQQKDFNSDINELTVGHSLIKQDFSDRSSEYQIDTIAMGCFPDISSGDVRHTNHLSSIHHLQQGDRLFIKLDHATFFDPINTIFGLFMIAP